MTAFTGPVFGYGHLETLSVYTNTRSSLGILGDMVLLMEARSSEWAILDKSRQPTLASQ